MEEGGDLSEGGGGCRGGSASWGAWGRERRGGRTGGGADDRAVANHLRCSRRSRLHRHPSVAPVAGPGRKASPSILADRASSTLARRHREHRSYGSVRPRSDGPVVDEPSGWTSSSPDKDVLRLRSGGNPSRSERRQEIKDLAGSISTETSSRRRGDVRTGVARGGRTAPH